MKKSLLIPLLIPVVAFAVVKGIFWFQVKRAVDQFAESVELVMRVEYGAIETSFDGVAAVTDIRLVLVDTGTPIYINQVQIQSPDWLQLLTINTPLESEQLPHQLDFRVVGLEQDLNAPYFQWLLQNQPQQSQLQGMLGCDQAELNEWEFLKQLSNSLMTIDLEFSYRFNPESEYINVDSNIVFQDLFTSGFSADVDLGVSELKRSDLKGIVPKLGGLSFRYSDDQYTSQRVAYCAEQGRESVDAFVDRHVALSLDYTKLMGLKFGESVVEAYRQLVLKPRSLSLELTATNAVGPAEWMSKAPQQHFEDISVVLNVNGQEVRPLDVSWQQPTAEDMARLAELAGLNGPVALSPDKGLLGRSPDIHSNESMNLAKLRAESSSMPMVRGVLAKAKPPKAKEVQHKPGQTPETAVPALRYRDTELVQLARYTGEKARVDTRNGRRIDGTIVRVERDLVLMKPSIAGGTAELPILFRHIERARVLR